MSSTYSPNLRIQLMGTGDQAGTWGTTTNVNLGGIIENAISGYTNVNVISTDQAFTYAYGLSDLSANQSGAAVVHIASATSNSNVYAPPNPKTYIVFNDTAYSIIIYNSTAIGNTTPSGFGVTIPAGQTILVYSNGSSFYAVNSLTTNNLTGTTQYSIPYQSASGTTTFLSPTTAGYLLKTNNTGSAPSWVAPSTLTVGTATNATTATNLSGTTQYSLPYQSGSGSTSYIAPGTNGYVLRSFSTSGAPYWDSALNLYAGGVNVNNGVVSNNYSLALITAGGGGTQVVYAGTTGAYNPYTNVLSVAGINVSGTAYSNNQVLVSSPNTNTAGTDGGWITFTPVLAGSNGGVTFTYSANAQQGRYLVMGNMVYVQIYIGWTAASATTDQLVINNLPLTGSALPSGWGNIYNGFGLLQCSHAVSYGLQLFPVVLNGGNKLYLYAPNGSYPLQGSSTSNFNAGVTISSTGFVYGCFSYSTS